MVKVSILRDACNAMVNAERRGKRQVILRPSSKILIKFLELMQKNGYIGEFELVDDHRAGKVVVNLTGRLNKAVVISPRYSISLAKIEKTATELLPSRQFGHMILTTPYGMMDHHEAQRRHTGGKIVGCFY